MAVPVSDDAPGAVDRSVSVADSAVSAGGTLRTSGLGSCLGIALHDPETCVGGLVHPMLPFREDEGRTAARYVDAGVRELLETLVTAGASPDRTVARVAGGATVVEFDWDDDDAVGSRNVAAAERVLAATGVEVVGTETGGEHGRSVRFDTATGDLAVERTDGVRTVL